MIQYEMKVFRYIGVVAGLVLLFVIAFATRYAILHAHYADYGRDLPFTLESALQYRAIATLYEGGALPARDPMIQYPEGINTHQTDTVMAEYVYAFLADVLPDSMSLPEKIRWLIIGWFSLSVPLLAGWVYVWTGSRTGAGVAGFFWAVSLAAVIRSSGLELSRENFAIPFLVAHCLFDAKGYRSNSRASYVWALLSACSLGLALAAWDMVQFYVLLWVMFWAFRIIRTGPRELFGHTVVVVEHGSLSGTTRTGWARLFVPALALLLTALISPYHRAHGLLLGPAMWLVAGMAVVVILERRRALKRGQRLLWVLGPLLLYVLLPHDYGIHYHHFVELLTAKIQFLNQKPADPALLTFNQRIMWVPALDSATWTLTGLLFPATLFLVLLSGVFALLPRGVAFRKALANGESLTYQYLFFLCLSLFTYVLFVRFHVYAALFCAAWIGWWWATTIQQGRWRPYVALPLIVLGGLVEAARVWEEPGRWGRPNVYYQELRETTDWLSEHVAPEPVLANFGVSASILTYGQCPIVLHPKFESPDIRERVEAYGTHLFVEDEEAFRDWADAHGAAYYVYAMGEFAQRSPELQMRYFVNALDPPEEAAARMFEEVPHEARYFEYLWGNRKYRVFRVISRVDEERADQLTIFAERALAEGNLQQAEELAWGALALFPAQYRAREVIRHVGALREQGFAYELPQKEINVNE